LAASSSPTPRTIIAALAVHLPVRVGPFEVARQQLGALLDLLGLFEGVVRLDVAEVQRLGVVRPVGVDRGDLPLFFDQRHVIDVGELSPPCTEATPRLSPADDDQISVLGHAW